MNVESASRIRRATIWRVGHRPSRFASPSATAMALVGVAIAATAVALEPALAQPATPGAVEGTGLLPAVGRLDPLAISLIVGAAVIVVLLIVRIAAMVRGERRSAERFASTSERARSRGDNGVFEHSTLRASTDWGHDQNKRSAPVREPVRLTTTTVQLPSLEEAVTQWTISNVQSAADASRQANETLGKPTDLPPSPYRTAFNPYFRGEAAGDAIEVVEVADTLLQAELLVQLGDPKHAMTLLSNHIRTHERPGPAIWLMLLNLYQATGRKSQYEALAKGFSTLFNAMVPDWSASPEIVARDLETYPQVLARLQAAWNKPAARPYVEGLLNDDRGGSRRGFSLTAYRELLFLQEIVNQLDLIASEEEEREDIQRKLGRTG